MINLSECTKCKVGNLKLVKSEAFENLFKCNKCGKEVIHELKYQEWDRIDNCQDVTCGAIIHVCYEGLVFGTIKSMIYYETKKYYIGQIEHCSDNNKLGLKKGDFVSFKAENVKGFLETTNCNGKSYNKTYDYLLDILNIQNLK